MPQFPKGTLGRAPSNDNRNVNQARIGRATTNDNRNVNQARIHRFEEGNLRCEEHVAIMDLLSQLRHVRKLCCGSIHAAAKDCIQRGE